MRSVVMLAKGVLTVLLLVAVVLGSLTACSSPGADGPVVAAAAAESMSHPAEDAPPSPMPAEPDPCTPENPCQHVPEQARSVEHSLGRTGSAFCDAVPVITGTDLGPRHHLERPGLPASTSSPVPLVAVRAPVAALCVDRN